ncbi:extracellular solute-binding protein [Chloroflexia bacterium SDU3-3]|nr:extracellular solute-binding protein [Chloroflexia bacterium SDU3-3]
MRRVFSLLCLCSLLLSACGPGNSEDDGPIPGLDTSPVPTAQGSGDGTSSGATITFAAWEYEMSTYETLATKFHEENPGINVVIVSMDELSSSGESDAPQDEVSRMRRVVSGADTAAQSSISPEVAASGLLLDMKPLMESDAGFKRDDFYPGVLDRGTYDKGMLVLPRYVWLQILAYNKDLFKNAGVPEPKSDWTWNDLFGAAEQIAAFDSKAYGFYDPSSGFYSLLSEIESRKINVLDVSAADADLTQPELVSAIEKIQGLITNRTIYSGVSKGSKNQSDPQQVVRDGHVGIFPPEMTTSYMEGATDIGKPQTAADLPFTMGKINYPKSDALLSTINNSNVEGFVISSGTQHPNEAWKWVEFLSRQTDDSPNGRMMMVGTGRIPARQSVAEASKFWDNVDDEAKTAYQTTLAQQVVRMTKTPDYTTLGPLSQAIYDVTTGGKKPADALKSAQEQLTAQVDELAKATPTPTPQAGPVVVSTPVPQTAPDGAATLVFNPLGYDTSSFRKMARTFNDQKNGYFVQIKATDVTTSPVTLADAAKSADCFAWWNAPQSANDFAALLDLQPFFSADASFKQDDFPPAVLSQLTSNGGIYGLPYTFNTRVLGYNKTIFDSAGIETPTYTWKPDDFLAAAKALTTGSGDKKQYGYIPLGGAISDLSFFITQFGGQLSTGSGKDVQPNFSDPTVVKAIQWYIDLAKVHGVTPKFTLPYSPSDNSSDNSYDMIQKGLGAMWLDSGYGSFPVGVDGVNSGLSWQPGLAPLPLGGAGMQSGDLWVRGFYVSAKTEQQQGCWEWLKFVTSNVNNLNGDLPARISVASSAEFTSSANETQLQMIKIYQEALKQPSKNNPGLNALYSSSQFGFDTYWFYKAIDDAIEKDANLAEELKKADELTKANMKCVAETQKPATCAKQTDPEYDGYNTEDPDPNRPIGIERGWGG